MSIFGGNKPTDALPGAASGIKTIGFQKQTKLKIYRILPLRSMSGDYEERVVTAPGHPTIGHDYTIDFFKGWMIEEEFDAIRERFAEAGIELHKKGVPLPPDQWMKQRLQDHGIVEPKPKKRRARKAVRGNAKTQR